MSLATSDILASAVSEDSGISGASAIDTLTSTPNVTTPISDGATTTDQSIILSVTTNVITTYYSGIVSSGTLVSTVTITTGPTSHPSHSSASGGDIAGAVVGVLAAVAIALLAGWCLASSTQTAAEQAIDASHWPAGRRRACNAVQRRERRQSAERAPWRGTAERGWWRTATRNGGTSCRSSRRRTWIRKS